MIGIEFGFIQVRESAHRLICRLKLMYASEEERKPEKSNDQSWKSTDKVLMLTHEMKLYDRAPRAIFFSPAFFRVDLWCTTQMKRSSNTAPHNINNNHSQIIISKHLSHWMCFVYALWCIAGSYKWISKKMGAIFSCLAFLWVLFVLDEKNELLETWCGGGEHWWEKKSERMNENELKAPIFHLKWIDHQQKDCVIMKNWFRHGQMSYYIQTNVHGSTPSKSKRQLKSNQWSGCCDCHSIPSIPFSEEEQWNRSLNSNFGLSS